MTSTAQAITWLAQIQDLVDRFAVLFPRWPSLTPARAAISRAARQLEQLNAGRNPFSPDNPDPAGTAINAPYSFLHYMATTATATQADQLLDPLTGRPLIIDAPTRPDGSAAGIAETIDHYRALMARAEQIRASGGGTTPTPPPAAPVSSTPTPTDPPTPTAAPTAVQAASPAAAATIVQAGPPAITGPAEPSAGWAAQAASYAFPGVQPSGLVADAQPGPASPARASGGNWLPILGLGVLAVLVAGGGKGGRR